jgi:hypothetical protein
MHQQQQHQDEPLRKGLVLQQQLAAGGAGMGVLSLGADGGSTTPASSGVDLQIINRSSQQEYISIDCRP